jgi:hypothetical protein
MPNAVLPGEVQRFGEIHRYSGSEGRVQIVVQDLAAHRSCQTFSFHIFAHQPGVWGILSRRQYGNDFGMSQWKERLDDRSESLKFCIPVWEGRGEDFEGNLLAGAIMSCSEHNTGKAST